MENLLKWFDYPHARPHPSCAVSSHETEWTCIVGSSVICGSQPDSGESCIVLQSGLSCSFVAKFPQCSVVACSTWISCCRGRTLQTRPRMSVCEPLMPNVVSPKVHQKNCSYVSSADVPSDSLRKNLAWWAVTRRTLQNYKTVKIGGWALARVWVLVRDNTVLEKVYTQWLYVYMIITVWKQLQ